MGYKISRCRDKELIEGLQKRMLKIEELPYLDFEDRHWWVAWLDGRPAGYAGLRILGRYAWFSICAVFPSHRRKGLQKRLLAVRLAHARREGLKVVYTYTINGNHPSARALISKGFKPTTPPDKHYGCWAGEEDVIYWGLNL